MSLATLLVAAGYRGQVDAFRQMVRSCQGDVLVFLTPSDDAIRRALHALQFAGGSVHGVERRGDVVEEEALDELTRIARLYLGSDAVSPVRSAGNVEPARPGPRDLAATIVVRTTTFPGPAHKEYLAAHVIPGVPRSIYIPLHVPAFTMRIRVTLEHLGASLVDVLGVRVFRPENPAPTKLDSTQIRAVLAIAGTAEIEGPSLRALAIDGAVEFDLDVPTLWLQGRCIGIELRVSVRPVPSEELLATPWLERASRTFRDPRMPA